MFLLKKYSAPAGQKTRANNMLTLNIIPQHLKKDIKLQNIYELLKKILFILVISLTTATITILLARLILQIHLIKTVYNTTLLTKSTKKYGNKIRDINNRLNYVEKIQQETTPWSYLLEYIADNTGGDITFSRISIDKDNSSMRLRGLAKTRDSLLSLKKELENKECFTDIDFPIKNFLQKNDINFEINVKLKSYEFKRLQRN